MKKTLLIASAIALASAWPALSQETATDTPAAEAPAAEAPATDAPATEAPAADAPASEAPAAEAPANGSAVSDALDLGQTDGEAAPAAQEDPSYIKAETGDWRVECLRVPEGQTEPCQLYQLLEGADGASVAEARLFKVEGGEVAGGANIIVPLETLLTQKLAIQVDGGATKRYDFAFCTQIGCLARIGFTAQDIAAFKAGNVAKVSIVPALAPDQRVTVEMSLSGFTAGFDQLEPLPQ
ncbi:invasion associated locus B family protein [Litorisediminicola beolgyonensis]|uniref:Invasion associated locus B family protein n=1 Tax=Litorisediminicola beolgyonensis TaxID=1173614 RepID=A0ABW3ZFT2_9RHOB